MTTIHKSKETEDFLSEWFSNAKTRYIPVYGLNPVEKAKDLLNYQNEDLLLFLLTF